MAAAARPFIHRFRLVEIQITLGSEADEGADVIYFPAAALIALSAATAQPAPKPAPANPKIAAPVPVARTAFIQTMDAQFDRFDADKNKIISRAEIEQFQRAAAAAEVRARAKALFASLDADKNGQLSAAEFERMPISAPPINAAPILGESDINKDGRITLVEFRTAKLANFDQMDADKDGVVSVAEMRAAGLVK